MMKSYNVYRKYASISAYRSGRVLKEKVSLGVFQAEHITVAISQAFKASGTPGILLGADIVETPVAQNAATVPGYDASFTIEMLSSDVAITRDDYYPRTVAVNAVIDVVSKASNMAGANVGDVIAALNYLKAVADDAKVFLTISQEVEDANARYGNGSI